MNNYEPSHDPKFKDLIQQITPKSRRVKVENAVKLEFEDSSAWDRRGRKSSEIRRVSKTLRHIVSMQKWCEDESIDLNLRRLFRTRLRHIDHGASWNEIEAECTKARGSLNGAGRRRNDSKEYGPETTLDLGDGFLCIRINTIRKLRAAGRRAENCLVSNAHGYHDELRRGTQEFWEIKNDDESLAIASVEIDYQGRGISQFVGSGWGRPTLPKRQLWNLCIALDAHGDYLSEFVESGVVSLFWKDGADPDKPHLTRRNYQIWGKNGEVAIYDRGELSWSMFRFSKEQENAEGNWHSSHRGSLDTKAIQVMAEFDEEIREFLEQVAPQRQDAAIGRWRRRPRLGRYRRRRG